MGVPTENERLRRRYGECQNELTQTMCDYSGALDDIDKLKAENAKLREERDEFKALSELKDTQFNNVLSSVEMIKAENAKLRERIEWLEDELRKHGSATDMFMTMAREYQKDNKKLRELYAYFLRQKKLAGCFDCFGGNCEEWGKCHGDCTFERRARELGIEASE